MARSIPASNNQADGNRVPSALPLLPRPGDRTRRAPHHDVRALSAYHAV
jgi:hypothetical protein